MTRFQVRKFEIKNTHYLKPFVNIYKYNAYISYLNLNCYQRTVHGKDCNEVLRNGFYGDDVHTIRTWKTNTILRVRCFNKHDNGGWTVKSD